MRLIDADALANDLRFDVEMDARALDNDDLVGKERELIQFDKDCKQNCVYYLTETEPIDAVPVIRCKDCKYVSVEPCKDYEDVYICNRNYWTRAQGGNMPNDFCSKGERKEE